jgi:hypothetical protein
LQALALDFERQRQRRHFQKQRDAVNSARHGAAAIVAFLLGEKHVFRVGELRHNSQQKLGAYLRQRAVANGSNAGSQLAYDLVQNIIEKMLLDFLLSHCDDRGVCASLAFFYGFPI